MEKINIVLVDDHQVVRDGVKSLLSEFQDVKIIGEADSAQSLFQVLNSSLLPDVIILDINLPDQSGIELTRQLKQKFPSIKVLILTMYNSEEYIFNAIKAGASGYLPKTATRAELIGAVRQAAQGNEYFAGTISNIILKSYIRQAKQDNETSDQKLTPRETEILRLFAGGRSNPEIADELFISVRTVESHKNHIMQKFELKTTVDLIKFAIRSKIIEI
jgi:DNA-binding NarL/FixJ family response regulator